jgi:hypothetical protein
MAEALGDAAGVERIDASVNYGLRTIVCHEKLLA